MLYGLVHQRYILTRMGLQSMVSLDLYRMHALSDLSPRLTSTKMAFLAPVPACTVWEPMSCHVGGRTFQVSIQSSYSVQIAPIYIPRPVADFRALMVRSRLLICLTRQCPEIPLGAFFGTTFSHLFFQSYRELAPAPFWKAPIGGGAESPSSSRTGDDPNAQNPNPHGGQKAAAGYVYVPRIYGFKVSERAKCGPRMQWLRLRPESHEELDMVDWRGRWIDDEDQYSDDDDQDDPMLEDFDPVS